MVTLQTAKSSRFVPGAAQSTAMTLPREVEAAEGLLNFAFYLFH